MVSLAWLGEVAHHQIKCGPMTGPNGEKRPGDVIANALHVAKIATDEVEEEYVDESKRLGGRKGGRVRAEAMTSERRQEIAKQAAKARWRSDPGSDTI